MKVKLAVLLVLAAGTIFAGPRFFVGFGGYGGYGGWGYYPPAPVYAYGPPPVVPRAYYAPPYPGPGYTWVGGYYYPIGARWGWRAGYWARPPYLGARWVAPRYFGHRYYGGYWRR